MLSMATELMSLTLLQGFQYFVEDLTGFGHFSYELLQLLGDDYPRSSIKLYALRMTQRITHTSVRIKITVICTARFLCCKLASSSTIATSYSKPISNRYQSQHACLHASFDGICNMWQATRYVQGRLLAICGSLKLYSPLHAVKSRGPLLISVALHLTHRRMCTHLQEGRNVCVKRPALRRCCLRGHDCDRW